MRKSYGGFGDTLEAFGELKGKTLASITGMHADSDCVAFTCSDGTVFELRHTQDCCETVQVAEVIGEPEHLIGTPILMAEAVEETATQPDIYESGTWTFYKLGTIEGYVTLRWLGESNGWYSESVDLWIYQEEQNAD